MFSRNLLPFSVNHYNEILHCYKDNHRQFVVRTFIEKMSPVKPNDETYQLLLAAVCEVSVKHFATELYVPVSGEFLYAPCKHFFIIADLFSK